MSWTSAWIAKSLLIGAAAGVVTFAVSYAFLTVHQEVGIQPAISYRAGLLVFVFATAGALIYFRMKAGP